MAEERLGESCDMTEEEREQARLRRKLERVRLRRKRRSERARLREVQRIPLNVLKQCDGEEFADVV